MTNPPSHRAGRLATLALALCVHPTVNAAEVLPGENRLLAALQQGLRPSFLKPGETLPGWSLQQRMAELKVPGVAIAILQDGEVVASAGYGLRQAGTNDAVNADTLFNVGSVSKLATAAVALRMVAQGRLDLDRDVNGYLTSWHIAPMPGVADSTVSLRMLLSHTSGLTVHGFPDYLPGAALPTLLQSLDGVAPAKNAPIRLQRAPGLLNDYSGGGTVVEQLMIEEVAEQPLEAVARAEVFAPIGMPRSTFASPLPASLGNIAMAHDDNGAATALPRGWQAFPQEGAAGWWTTANELGAFLGTLIRSYQGRSDYLPGAIAIQMMTEVAPSWHGLGPRLDGAGTTRIFHHGGSNDSYMAWVEGYLETGDGFVILTNGANGWQLRSEIRNALSDALGRGVNPPIRTITLDPVAARVADYAGTYELASGFPVDHRRSLTDVLDVESIEIKFAGGTLSVILPDETGELLPLTPSRFVAPTVFGTQYEFHRDARGVVRAVSVEHGASRAYYRRRAGVAGI
jgi:CubicO group peptidase (beta-lactamase class C family)